MTSPCHWPMDKAILPAAVMICAQYVEMEGICFFVIAALGPFIQVGYFVLDQVISSQCFLLQLIDP